MSEHNENEEELETSTNQELLDEDQEEKNEGEDFENTDENESDNEDDTEHELSEREKQFLARAKKAEAKLKKLKAKPKKTNNTDKPISRDEAILLAKGYTVEEVDLASKLAKINEVSLLEATEDDIFKSKVEKRKQKELAEKASLGASKSGIVSDKTKPYSKMTEEERIKQFNETMEKVG